MKQKALLVGVQLPNDQIFDESMIELKELARACEIETKLIMSQKLDSIHPRTYVGQGKLIEIKGMIERNQITLVIFNDELSPSQLRNIEEVLSCEISDRTLLILDIFAKRAKTKEAMLQVEIAKLSHLLPRLVGMNASLSHQQGGKGFRGAGEKKIELNRRSIEHQLVKMKAELEQIVLTRKTQRKQRKHNQLPIVALVGYTNVGKSTIMNYHLNDLQHKKVYSEDMLFATLETSTRRIQRKQRHDFLLTDTIGFVYKLPHHLIEAFKSTLEEVIEADLIIHVMDASSKWCDFQSDVVKEVLKSIGVLNQKVIYVYNKVDLNPHFTPTKFPSIAISSRTGLNMDQLLNMIDVYLYGINDLKLLRIPNDALKDYYYLKENYSILYESFEDTGVVVEVALIKGDEPLFAKYQLNTH